MPWEIMCPGRQCASADNVPLRQFAPGDNMPRRHCAATESNCSNKICTPDTEQEDIVERGHATEIKKAIQKIRALSHLTQTPSQKEPHLQLTAWSKERPFAYLDLHPLTMILLLLLRETPLTMTSKSHKRWLTNAKCQGRSESMLMESMTCFTLDMPDS